MIARASAELESVASSQRKVRNASNVGYGVGFELAALHNVIKFSVVPLRLEKHSACHRRSLWLTILLKQDPDSVEEVPKIVKQPGRSDWAALYQAAITFKETAPWEWMDNEDLFAVENPDDGEVGYCSVLGAGGEEFGLGMFVGEEGYHRYKNLISEEVDSDDDLEESIMTRGISMLLVDRGVLQKEDHEIIRSLGLRFRGRNAWPSFRSQRPGYVPWFLEENEVRFLTAALHQALAVANEVRDGTLDIRAPQRENLVLTRCYRGGRWLGEWQRTPAPSQQSEETADGIDAVKEAELHLLSRAPKVSETWEIDIFILPIPIGSVSEAPHFPSCFLLVERKLGLIIGTNLTEPWLTVAEKQDEVIQILKKVKQIPSEIRVKTNKVKRIVEPITSILGIKLRVGSLPMLERAKASLYEHSSRRYT